MGALRRWWRLAWSDPFEDGMRHFLRVRAAQTGFLFAAYAAIWVVCTLLALLLGAL